jgi:hypothetical protein
MRPARSQDDIVCDSDVQAFLADASTADAADSQKDCADSPSRLLSRRVTFSDDHIVHQMPGAPSSTGWESEGGQQQQHCMLPTCASTARVKHRHDCWAALGMMQSTQEHVLLGQQLLNRQLLQEERQQLHARPLLGFAMPNGQRQPCAMQAGRSQGHVANVCIADE